MSVGRICVREVDLCDPQESAQVAARRMHDRKVGTLVVCNGAKHPVGIVTDRDLAIRVVGEGRDPATTSVAAIMTDDPRVIRDSAPIETALTRMRAGAYRRLPVVNELGELVGVISLDDILALLTEEFREIGNLLKKETPESLSVP